MAWEVECGSIAAPDLPAQRRAGSAGVKGSRCQASPALDSVLVRAVMQHVGWATCCCGSSIIGVSTEG